jgi:alcohol oxidase
MAQVSQTLLETTAVCQPKRCPRYIDDKTGRRSDTAHNFIYNQADNKNLTVLTESRGVRVLFECVYSLSLTIVLFSQSHTPRGTRAVGVEYITENAESSSYAYASKLVVLSAGSFGTPAILERSGIGAPDVLRKNEIAQLVDLPGVGERYNGQ